MQGGFDDREKKELGRRGEEAALKFLKKQGFKLLEWGYRSHFGEIDLIVEKKGKILFVEVKTRRSFEAVSPLELIPPEKIRHITKTAQHYLMKKKFHDKPADFALVMVDWSEKAPRCELVEGIFFLEGGY